MIITVVIIMKRSGGEAKTLNRLLRTLLNFGFNSNYVYLVAIAWNLTVESRGAEDI